MTYIPVQNKISLIRKYIQINILRNKGKAMHVDIPENEVFAAIIEDLNAYNELISAPEKPKQSIDPVIDALKTYQAKQNDMRFQINALLNAIENYRQEEEGQLSMDEIIRQLEDLNQE